MIHLGLRSHFCNAWTRRHLKSQKPVRLCVATELPSYKTAHTFVYTWVNLQLTVWVRLWRIICLMVHCELAYDSSSIVLGLSAISSLMFSLLILGQPRTAHRRLLCHCYTRARGLGSSVVPVPVPSSIKGVAWGWQPHPGKSTCHGSFLPQKKYRKQGWNSGIRPGIRYYQDLNFRNWNNRSLYRSGALQELPKEIIKC